jgi:hypothetical protein
MQAGQLPQHESAARSRAGERYAPCGPPHSGSGFRGLRIAGGSYAGRKGHCPKKAPVGWAKSPAAADDIAHRPSRDFAYAVKQRGRTAWAKAHERLCKLRRIEVGLARLRHSKIRFSARDLWPRGVRHPVTFPMATLVPTQIRSPIFMCAIPPLLACKGFVRGPGCSPHGRGFF